MRIKDVDGGRGEGGGQTMVTEDPDREEGTDKVGEEVDKAS